MKQLRQDHSQNKTSVRFLSRASAQACSALRLFPGSKTYGFYRLLFITFFYHGSVFHPLYKFQTYAQPLYLAASAVRLRPMIYADSRMSICRFSCMS